MTHHPAEETLHMLVDGELSAAQAADAERHVENCAVCQQYVAGLEKLRRAVSRLPKEIDPPSHIESSIRTVLGAVDPRAANGPNARAVRRERASMARSRPWWIAIAACLALVVAGSLFVRQYRVVNAPAPIATADPDLRMLAELKQELAQQRHLLSPETVVVVEQNLRTIDEAITATQGALAKDPSNSQLASMLEDTRRRRSDYIRTALDLASEL